MSLLLQKLYRYHAWANIDLFDKLGTLDEEKYETKLHTSSRLINHYHVVAEIFAAHLSGTQNPHVSDNTLDTPTLDDLRATVTLSDQWYLDYLRSASSENLSEAIPFVFTDGDKGYMTREEMLTTLCSMLAITAEKSVGCFGSFRLRRRGILLLSIFIRSSPRVDDRERKSDRQTGTEGLVPHDRLTAR